MEKKATEVVTVDYDGNGVTIGFNAKYVVDFTEAVDDPRVRITLKDGNTQGLFTSEGEQSHDYRYVVMPMQLRGEEVS